MLRAGLARTRRLPSAVDCLARERRSETTPPEILGELGLLIAGCLAMLALDLFQELDSVQVVRGASRAGRLRQARPHR
jgi:hypothetical protein